MDDDKLSDLVKILSNYNKLIKYYSLSWFLIGFILGIVCIITIALIFGRGQ